MNLRPMTAADAAIVLAIYQAGLDGGNASFERIAPTWEMFDAAKLPGHRHVAIDEHGVVVGWVAAAATSIRAVCAGVVEHSVYVDSRAQGRGIGRALVNALIAASEAAGIWTIQSAIFPENRAGLALHRAAGFRTVGVRERAGRHAAHGDRWRDTVLVERRSPAVI